jgi:protein-S-isoprenylcysteine O-methyltransferase Ste14
MELRTGIFLVVSGVITALSWSSLRTPRSHGFYRYFAFEIILLLILLNAGVWFHDPFSWLQLFSWLALIVSALLALHAFWLLRKLGKPAGRIENTTQLVRVGVYRYIRHPLYASLLYLSVGAFLKDPSLVGLALLVGSLAFLFATARVEEKENLERFGAPYAVYMQETRIFVPYLF